MDKVYHIYAKNRVIFHSLKEEEFRRTWTELQGMVGLMKTDYMVEDLTYEEVYNLHEGDSPAGSPSF
jgi:hypothetical protein|tara:strand:- start:234 stop:434 length:201 start_codon:yes stop_codon:yes gene_type:complete